MAGLCADNVREINHYTNLIRAEGDSNEALIVNISRQGIIYILVMFALGAAFDAAGLVWAQPVTDVLSLVIAVFLYKRNQ